MNPSYHSKKAIRLMKFAQSRSSSNPLFLELKILKLYDQIKLNQCIFVHKTMNNLQPENFDNWFQLTRNIHNHFTRKAKLGLISLNLFNSSYYGRHSPLNSCVRSWNFIQGNLSPQNLPEMNDVLFKNTLKCSFFNTYCENWNYYAWLII